MITIIFESHSTTVDNEAQLAAGWYDVALSKAGEKQAKDLGRRHKDDTFDAIFCSDLQRSFKTAELAFGTKFPIIQDKRLRECNYGDLNRKPKDLIDSLKVRALEEPYPNGESYQDTDRRMRDFLLYLTQNFDGKRILIIGHRATQYGLECNIRGISLKQAVTDPWKWQPGWEYILSD